MKTILEAGSEVRVVFELKQSQNVDVYIYATTDNTRSSATVPLVQNNNQAEQNKQYSVPFGKGLMVVAYPSTQETAESRVDTLLEFDYWMSVVEKEQQQE